MLLDSPKEPSGFNLSASGGEEYLPSEDFIKVKLFFFTESKALRQQIFTEEWYTVMEGEYGDDVVSKDMQPWLEFEVYDHNKFGEMLVAGLKLLNEKLVEIESDYRFSEDAFNENLFEMYMAKKKTGKPKDDYPNMELGQLVKEADEDSLYTLVYTQDAVTKSQAQASASEEKP